MGIAQIIREDDKVTVITDQGHSATAEQYHGWSEQVNNEKLDEAIEDALKKDE